MLITTKTIQIVQKRNAYSITFHLCRTGICRKKCVSKPYFAVGVEQVLIQIICDSSSELNLSQNVFDRVPRNTLTPKLDYELAIKLF